MALTFPKLTIAMVVILVLLHVILNKNFCLYGRNPLKNSVHTDTESAYPYADDSTSKQQTNHKWRDHKLAPS